jgi:hypothetical protein
MDSKIFNHDPPACCKRQGTTSKNASTIPVSRALTVLLEFRAVLFSQICGKHHRTARSPHVSCRLVHTQIVRNARCFLRSCALAPTSTKSSSAIGALPYEQLSKISLPIVGRTLLPAFIKIPV